SSPAVFFLLLAGDHRDLHSFPTRRSSDLAVFVFIVSAIMHTVAPHHRNDFSRLPDEDRVLESLRHADLRPGDYVVPFASSPKERSEEHTSELQSRENLVCRLLLEKKKDNC